ncbi:MAG: IPT/TIG domain-containing protein [Gemmatales bacterium]
MFLIRTSRPGSSRPSVNTVKLVLETLEDRTVPTLLGNQLYPSDHPWNQPITNAPVSSLSTAVMNNIVNTYGNNRLHPDFGQYYGGGIDLYGIPYNIVHGNSTPKVSVIIDAYDNESDLVPVPIPAGIVLEGDYQNGPKVGVDNRGDSHMLIYDVDNNVAYEFYRASRPSENADGRWHADQQTVWDMKTNNFRTLGYTSADAAGLSLLAGLVRPDEGLPVSQGGQGVINHAIRFTLTNSIILDQFLYPASHTANPGNNNTAIQPPMGSRFRLKASVDISTLNPQAKIIAQAMKDYGMILADNGSNFFFSGATYAVDHTNSRTLTWNDNDIQSTTNGLKRLRYADFELVDLTPRVTDLSTHSGGAGTAVTVTGSNFSGAAGRLQVNFGTVPATSVVILNDTTITCVAPAGVTGTVNVRVQSGTNTGANGDNYTTPIFGYGTSAVTTGGSFTFTTTQNQPPTIVTPATASAAVIFGKTVGLSALGTDDGGAANLRYTWSSTGPAAVSYSLNGTNAASNTVATFTRAGVYNFTVTITDAGGLSVTSAVTVTVSQKLTTIAVTPLTATVRVNQSLQFVATAMDQFGQSLTTQPTIKWSISGTAKGTITTNGLYTAPRYSTSSFNIVATAGTVKGKATVKVIR